MIAIRSVVCPVDFSAATDRQVTLAADVCRAFSARLVLHHNVNDVSVGAGVGWMWHARDQAPQPPPQAVDDNLRRVLALVPQGVVVETCITRGATTEAVLRVSDAAEADVIVLSEHAGKTEDHASVIEFMLAHSNSAVLALHNRVEDEARPTFIPSDEAQGMQAMLVPVSHTTDAHPQIEFAANLARVFPLRLHVLHVVGPPLERGKRVLGRKPARTAVTLQVEGLRGCPGNETEQAREDKGDDPLHPPSIAQRRNSPTTPCTMITAEAENISR